MSFDQIYDRIARLARSIRAGSQRPDDLRRAEELIDHENRRDREREARRQEESTEERARLRSVIAAIRKLGLEPPVTFQQAAQAWRRELLRVHPDRNEHRSDREKEAGAIRTREVNEAFAIIKEHFRWNP